ncbi:DUF7689 domain-containing protein [Paenibacillus chitinolyticus]|uniref:DUF7689 domain-containing protein n=1 Tax=Paenibacillus chitinolyticus TaxID=79263 RepID=UPI003D07BE97
MIGKKVKLAIVSFTVMIFAFGSTVFAVTNHSDAWFREHLRSGVSYSADFNSGTDGNHLFPYNCLAYAIDETAKWVWPWKSSGYDRDATATEMTAFLRSYGYSDRNTGNPNNPPKLIAYGKSLSSVGHIARVLDSSTTKSKWGIAELVTTYSLSPYNSSAGYGPAVQYYY